MIKITEKDTNRDDSNNYFRFWNGKKINIEKDENGFFIVLECENGQLYRVAVENYGHCPICCPHCNEKCSKCVER